MEVPRTAGWPERTWRNLYSVDVARGIVPGAEVFVGFAEITLDSAHSEVPLWETPMPHAFTVPNSIQLSVVSSSASDTGAIRLVYLDGDLVKRRETVTLNGLTPVLTSATDIRAVLTAYSVGQTPVGNITFSHAGVTYAVIPAGSVQFNSGVQRVPANSRLMIHSMFAGATSGTSAARVTIGLYSSMVDGESFQSLGPVYPVAKVGVQDSSVTMSGFPPLAIPAGEWFGLFVSCDKGATVTAGLFGWLEKENP